MIFELADGTSILEQFFLTVGQNNFGNKIPLIGFPMWQHFRPFQVGGPPAQMMRRLQPTNRKFYDNFSSEIINTYLKRFGVLSRSRY